MASKKDKFGSRELKKQFPSNAACLKFIFNTKHTKECSCGGAYRLIKGRTQFQCSKCRFQIAPLVNTIFQDSHVPLKLWFQALVMFSNAKSGLSAKYLEREINVNYRTAWRMLKLIRESLTQSEKKLKGDVEMDEGYFGGKGDGGSNNELLGVVMHRKTKVIAAVERKGDMKAEVVPDVTAKTIGTFIEKNVQPFVTHLMTDKSNRYAPKFDVPYNRLSVDHGRKEYVRGDIHVNNVESFWSHVKRSLKGVHKAVSKKYFQTYLDFYVWQRNNRHSDKLRFEALLGVLVHG